MQAIKEHLALMREIKGKIKNNNPSYDDLFGLQSVMNYMLEDACEIVDNKLGLDITEYRKSARQIGDYIRFYANQRREYADDLWDELYWSVYKIEGRNRILDSYLLFLERKREEKDRFYKPRRTCYMKIGLMDALQDILDDKLDILSISMPPGTGKLLADDTPVLTSVGWKSHGDLSVGDYVYGLDGRLKKVEHVFAKDFADVLVTFSNGEKIQCHENHEWVVFDRKRNIERKIETKELFQKAVDSGTPGKRGHRYHYQLPAKRSFLGKTKLLPVDPYVLGAWLGDGTETKPCITICNTDGSILDKIRECYELSRAYEQQGCVAYTFLGLRKDLESLGMCHSRKKLGKRIPDIYMTASEGQRLELLAGLIDTDGCCAQNERKYSISTVNEELKEGIISLVSTFGWRTNVSVEKAAASSSGIVGRKDVYRIGFTPTFEIPCRVTRKKMKTFSKQRRISITAVERVQPKQGNCIQVEGGVYCVGRTMLPTHNSTVEKFFHAGLCGWFPADFNLFYSHSSDITRMYYDGVTDILTNGSEYAWNEMFPELKVTGTNAKLEQLNIGAYKPFPNVQCTSVGSKNAGKVRASKFLLCDDLIGGIEEALNKNTLEKLWSIYSVDARQRKIDGCKEIHIATRWSVHDVIGRLQRMYDGSDRCRFIAVPDIDPETGFSNFQFDINPFSVAFFHDQEKLMDEVSYRCLYKNEPIEREGLLYTENNIRFYMALPEQAPDEILGQVDAKAKGTDFMFMPVLYRYGDDYYCVDCVCNKESDYEMQYRRLADTIVLHRMNNCEFESNMGGDRVGMEVSKRVQAKGWVCNITDRPTESNKEARIFQCSNWVQQHILFKSKEMYPRKCDYAEMMHQLLSYSVAGKNPNDDVPDCFANFALRVTGANKTATVEAAFNPFRRNFW